MNKYYDIKIEVRENYDNFKAEQKLFQTIHSERFE